MNKKSQNIILLGPSCVGKTCVGNVLSKKIGFEWIDSDSYLHETLDFPQLDNYSSEDFTKKKELEVKILQKCLLEKENLVFSSGEGLVMFQTAEMLLRVREILKNYENVILLLPSKNVFMTKCVLSKRKGKHFTSKESVEFEKSIILFKKLSKEVIYTHNLTVEEVADKIIKIMGL